MKRKSLWVETLLGLALTCFVGFSYLMQWSFLKSLELKFYDTRSYLRQTPDPSSDIAIVAIDEDSIQKLGRWPWPRSRIAALLEALKGAGPKVIGLDILLTETEENPGLGEVEALRAKFAELVASKKILQQKGVDFALEFSSSQTRLNSDEKLIAALGAAQGVVLPMYFTASASIAKPEDVPPSVSSWSVSAVLNAATASYVWPVEWNKATPPLAALAQAASGVGHVNIEPDFDGVIRSVSPVVKYGDRYFAHFGVELVRKFYGLSPQEVRVHPGRALEVGKLSVPVNDLMKMMVSYNGPEDTFRYYSFFDVLNGKVAADVFKDKIVLVGFSALSLGDNYVTPVGPHVPGVEVIANVIENIMHQKFLLRPDWAQMAELASIAVVGLFLMLLLPRLKAFAGALISFVLFGLLLIAGTAAFVNGSWLQAAYPAFLLAAGYTVVTTKRFLVTERGKELVEASAIETNKMLGLSFQGQGMLDLAFDKFRMCPLDDQLKDLLYNLALDFERKRQYNKAVSVYQHIAAKEPNYKDIRDKMKMLKAASEGAVFGGIGKTAKEGTVIVEGAMATKPTLGRYEIQKELGRGAMGIVYLGKDPKINRLVAIKTMMLGDGEDPAGAKEIKERFFREAESAGTLNHPNIVRIFDAGEEQDVSYIAMELLDGEDFTKFTAKEGLLPMEKTLEYAALVADALDYAHAQGVVHRDIKPANIMLIKDGSLRVTDFGIARLTGSSKTATGTVMGTPSYMSPEQVAGKKVDGRSDLFSLGVTVFELLTGEKPFKGGEGIGTLLFQIANDPHPDVCAVNAAIPKAVAQVIDKVLTKNPDERYQKGSELAKDLRACKGESDGTPPNPEATARAMGAIEPGSPAGGGGTARLQV